MQRRTKESLLHLTCQPDYHYNHLTVGAALGGGVLKASERVGCFTFFNGAPVVVGVAGRLAGVCGAGWEGTEGWDC